MTYAELQKITKAINAIVEQVDIGYEMGCLISAEFTPAPDYKTPILELFEKNGWDFEKYQQSLNPEMSYELHCMMF